MKSRFGFVLLVIIAACAIIGGGFGLLAVLSGTGFFDITQQSMAPAYASGDRIVVDKLFFRASGLQRGDVVIVRFAQARNNLSLKRIIGMPGEQVRIRGGHVFIDGALLDEPYLAPGVTTATMLKETWQLGSQEYFVMGDNRPESGDSRALGPVPAANVVGRVLVRYPAGPR